MMGRIFTIILLLFVISGEAQQIPEYTHYIFNYFGINPAVAGSKQCLDLKMGYRRQWVGFEGAPQTAYANLHGKIAESAYVMHALGGRVETDDTGPLSNTSLDLAYAIHLRANSKSHFAFGLAAGFVQWRIDGGAITLPETGFFEDPVLGNTESQFIYPTVDFGFWWYRDDRFIGLAVNSLLANEVQDVGIDTRLERHYILTGGKVTEIGDGFWFKPSFNFRYIPGSKPSIDVTGMIDYNDKVSLGLGARNGFGAMGLVKIDVFKHVTLGYSYDMSLSKMRFEGRNTHEVVLGIQACDSGDGNFIPCSAYD